MEKPAARITDPTSCAMPGHGAKAIASGSSGGCFDGLAAARKAVNCICGSALLSGYQAQYSSTEKTPRLLILWALTATQ